MPIKAHVKGKRKAPLPPVGTVVVASNSNEKSSINQSENKFPNGKIGKLPTTMTCFTTKKRKKPAPLPPIASVNKENHVTGDEMNNLSAISKRVSDKSPVKVINLNIFEPNNIRNDFHCSTKETNEVNVNLDAHRRHDIFSNGFREQRNDQIWICNYCTLQNPFWKIICDACERIKPYNTPNISNVNNTPFGRIVDNESAQKINEKNLMSSAMMRPKMIKPNNDVDKILNRNSMNVDVKSALSSKDVPNKRNSLCLFKYGDQNITAEALEMEKERIRTVIREMNNRALAQKYPGNNTNENKNETHTKTATINKRGKRRNGRFKYDIEKDYNLPSVRQNIAECSTKNDLSGNSNAVEPIKKIENTDNKVKCNVLVEEIPTHCDEGSPANNRTKLELDTNEQRNNLATIVAKNSIKSGIEHEIS